MAEHDEQSLESWRRQLCLAFSQLSSAEEAQAFLTDLLSVREIDEFARRLEVARMLRAGASYLEVSQVTGTSSTTVSRVSKCLNGTAGGYRSVLDKLDEDAHTTQ